jgi:hypothetical protein
MWGSERASRADPAGPSYTLPRSHALLFYSSVLIRVSSVADNLSIALLLTTDFLIYPRVSAESALSAFYYEGQDMLIKHVLRVLCPLPFIFILTIRSK